MAMPQRLGRKIGVGHTVAAPAALGLGATQASPSEGLLLTQPLRPHPCQECI